MHFYSSYSRNKTIDYRYQVSITSCLNPHIQQMLLFVSCITNNGVTIGLHFAPTNPEKREEGRCYTW